MLCTSSPHTRHLINDVCVDQGQHLFFNLEESRGGHDADGLRDLLIVLLQQVVLRVGDSEGLFHELFGLLRVNRVTVCGEVL